MFNINQVVLVDGYLALVKEVFTNHIKVNISFHGKVFKDIIVEINQVVIVKDKVKYNKDEQLKMFNRVFGTGFITIMSLDIPSDDVNVWNIHGNTIRINTSRAISLIQMLGV